MDGEFSIVPGYFNRRVRGKLGRMRKPRDFSVHPMDDGRIMVQADKAIGTFNFRTREGVLNTKGEYFVYLDPRLGAERYTFPAEFVKLCLEICPALDSETEKNGVIVVNTVKVI